LIFNALSKALTARFAPVITVAAALCAISLTACGKPKPPPARPPAEVGVVVMKSESVPLLTELPGRTSPYAISQVRPQINGIVQARLFQEGATVHAGQVLYRIDPAPYRAAVNQAKGVLASAEANLVAQKLKAERLAQLVKSDSIARQEYDDAQATYGQAQAVVQQGRAALETAQINLGYTQIKAPISGRIGVSAFTQGALVTSGQAEPLAIIQTLDPIYVDLTQSSAELLRLQHDVARGQVQRGANLSAKVKLILEDGSVYPLDGRLEFTDVTVDPASGSVTLRALFPNGKGMLLPGTFVRARIVEAVDQNAMLVPQQAVTRDPKGGATVFVVNAQNKAETRPLQIDQTAVGPNWLVLKGLAPGDRVITEGVQKVQAGATVRPAPAGSAPRGGPPGGGPQGRGKP
jgi:membrane fusion protein (multidrug efflux system)